MIGIIDYGMGNLKSVFNALDYIGEQPLIISKTADFDKVTHIILPGVGAYASAMKNLQDKGFVELIHSHIQVGKPFLGICLGMQVMSQFGTEPVDSTGLGLIPGKVEKINTNLNLPHVGWNNIDFKKDHPVFEGIKKSVDFYFVHSYQFHTQQEHIYGETEYGVSLNAIVGMKNIIGMQFHPEKSQDNGLKLLENFCTWDGLC